MRRCRRTDTIADVVADPARGVDALTDEQHRHVAICADCHAAVTGLERLDRALGANLRSYRRENLPISVLATPTMPLREAEGAGRATLLLSAAAVVVAVAVAVGGYGWLRGAGLGQQPSPTAAPSSVVAPNATPLASSTPEPAGELAVGDIAAVVDEPLVVRTAPGTSTATTISEERLWIGQRVRILAGPEESDGYTWWEVQVGEISGWVSDAERDESAPWLSPIGNGRIAFSRDQGMGDQQPGLFTVDLNGEDEQRLDAPETAGIRLVLSCGSGIGPARWSHDGVWVTFDATAGGCDRAVHVARADGSEHRTIGAGWGPVWRPDGTVVTYAENTAFVMCGRECGDNVADDPREIMTAEPTGGAPSELTRSEPFSSAFGPAWSPDRQFIAFSRSTIPADTDVISETSLATHLYIADADGRNERLLTTGQFPVWSPDGRWIVFSVPLSEGRTELHRIRPDGSDEAVLVSGENPVFSPDGTRIAYATEWGVMTMAPDGSDASGVIPAAAVIGIDWSPDGSQLLAAADYAGSFGLYRIGLEGAAPAIFGMGVNGYSPTWQPLLLDARLHD
jgi:Tol biopolymer transport system component